MVAVAGRWATNVEFVQDVPRCSDSQQSVVFPYHSQPNSALLEPPPR